MYIENIFENGWWEDAYPSSYPRRSAPGHKQQKPSKKSGKRLAYFSHLALLILFFFTARQSQKGGHGTMLSLNTLVVTANEAAHETALRTKV